MSLPVAALYCDRKGPYGNLAAEVYDIQRNAYTYAGPHPVVAHPPCGPWGPLAWACKYQDKGAGPFAVEQVRRWGGVLEHPVGSQLFKHCGIPLGNLDDPERPIDDHGGYTIVVPQWDLGHRGIKRTIFYVCAGRGQVLAELPPLPQREGGTPFPVQNMNSRERRITPGAMAWWLCLVAVMCREASESDGLRQLELSSGRSA